MRSFEKLRTTATKAVPVDTEPSATSFIMRCLLRVGCEVVILGVSLPAVVFWTAVAGPGVGATPYVALRSSINVKRLMRPFKAPAKRTFPKIS